MYRILLVISVSFNLLLQIVALREQNAHIQRKIVTGEGDEEPMEAVEQGQKIHDKVICLNSIYNLPYVFVSDMHRNNYAVLCIRSPCTLASM